LIPDAAQQTHLSEELAIEEPLKLWSRDFGAVIAVLKAGGAKRILDLGCGEGKLLRELLDNKQFTEILGMDVSFRSLEVASERLPPGPAAADEERTHQTDARLAHV